MPTISVFIRKDDLDKWKQLENKSQWLHERLNNTVFKDKNYTITETEPTKIPERSVSEN